MKRITYPLILIAWTMVSLQEGQASACDVDLVCEHGIIDDESCQCRCSTGWWGAQCDDKCIDSRGEAACKGYAHLCNNTQYANFVRKNCAATCGFCGALG